MRARRPAVREAGEPARWRRTPPAARDRILDAAEHLIAEDGFDATPTARIAERAGVAKGLLFYYFPRKTDLLQALFAERLPAQPLCSVSDIAVAGDVSGSLVRLANRLSLARHPSRVLRAILFREAGTHIEVRQHLEALHAGLWTSPNACSMPRALGRWTVTGGGRRPAPTSRSCCITPTPAGTTARCPTSPPRPTSSPARSLPEQPGAVRGR